VRAAGLARRNYAKAERGFQERARRIAATLAGMRVRMGTGIVGAYGE